MSAADPVGSQKFWSGGVPFNGVAIASRETRALQYWFQGLPVQTLFPAAFVPPPNPGNSGNGKGKGSPGQIKKQEMILAGVMHRRRRRKRHEREIDSIAFIPAQYLSPISGSATRGLDAVDWRTSTRRITLSPSGRTVRTD